MPMNVFSPFSGARWISAVTTGSRKTVAPALFFRKAFKLEGKVKTAQLRITALGLYECQINGFLVGDSVFSPGWTDYSRRCFYQTYNVAELLAEKGNVIGTIVGDGWYSGHIGWGGRQAYGDKPQLIAQLEVVFGDGGTFRIETDSSWRVRSGPVVENDLLMGESYDARLELPGWEEYGYDDSSWSGVELAQDPAILLQPSYAPPVRRVGELRPISSRDLNDRLFPARQFDFGQNFCGRVRIAVKAAAGTTLTLRFGEILQADGALYTENLREARATDIYVCKGGAKETWEPRFTFHGFRYVEVTGLKPEMSFDIVGVILQSDLARTGAFACSNPLLNQLQSNIVWSQRGNFLEVPTDCPQRDERLGWSGDAQIFLRTACFNMDVSVFIRKWLQDLRDAQSSSGAISAVAPRLARMDILPMEDGGPAYSDAVVLCPWTHYLWYGDRDILRENYAAMTRYMEFLEEHRCRDFIRGHPGVDPWGGYGDWLAPDGSGHVEGGTPKDLIGTAFYARIAEILSRIAGILDLPVDRERFAALRESIANAFVRRFLTSDGLLVSGTQTAYVLALHFGLLPESSRKGALAELVSDIRKRDFHLATGFVGTPYLLHVLSDHNELETAYRLLEQESFPSWLFPVKHGATTIWERWDGWTPEKGMQNKGMNSFNHYAYGAVGAWMYHVMAGLDLDEAAPGFARIHFRPRPGGTVRWAEASLTVPRGRIAIRWELEPESFFCEFCIPSGSTAIFSPPQGFVCEETFFGPGTHVVRLGRERVREVAANAACR
jgi:alpha-L-rhamnosidase